jgi:predicted outer membrane repeat protein
MRYVTGCAIALGLTIAAGASLTRAAVLKVPESWSTIQAAVDAAASMDTISIAPGTYRGVGNRDISIIEKQIVVLGRAGSERTVIDCQGLGRAFFIDGSHWFTATIEGFTIINGNAELGGAVKTELVNPVIRNCVFLSNHGLQGAAVYLLASATLENCRFSGNIDSSQGGGAVASMVGAVEFRNCVFTGNYANGTGGAVRSDGAALTFRQCTITRNRCEHSGGGIYAFDANVTLIDTICYGNCAVLHPEIVVNSDTRVLDVRCSDVRMSGVVADNVTQDGLIDADPLFCDPRDCYPPTTGGSYTLNQNSPCLPAGNLCQTLIGALPIGCPVAAVETGEPESGIRLAPGVPNPTSGSTTWQVRAETAASVALSVITADGRRLRSWPQVQLVPGWTRLTWDGADEAGRTVPAGRYFLVLREANGAVHETAVAVIR